MTRSRSRTPTETPETPDYNEDGTISPSPKSIGVQTVQEVANAVSKQYGHILRPARLLPAYTHLPTGIFTLDMALFGGIPETLISMLYGWESSGKSTTAMRVAAAAQAKYSDKQVVYMDVEGTFSNEWAVRHGVDTSRLFVVQPETGEQAVDLCYDVLRAKDTALVVVDSLPALVSFSELGKSAEDVQVAGNARLVGRMLRLIVQAMTAQRRLGNTATVVLINQFRNRIVHMGDPRILPGGNALKFAVSVRVELTNKEHLGKDDNDIETVDFNEHGFKVTKNKLGTGIRNGEFTMIRNPSHPLGSGFIDDGKTVLTYAKKFNLFTGGGASWRLDGVDKKFSRIQDAVDWLYENRDEYTKLTRRLISIQREHAGLRPDGWY